MFQFVMCISRKLFPLTAQQSFTLLTILYAFSYLTLAMQRDVLTQDSLTSSQIFNSCLKVVSGGWKYYFHQRKERNWNKPMLINPPPEMIWKGIIFNQISGLTFILANCISLSPPASVCLYHLPKDEHFTVFEVPSHHCQGSLPNLCPLSSQKHE